MRKTVLVDVCDDCPPDNRQPATRTICYSVNGDEFTLLTCNPCGRRFDRDMAPWMRVSQLGNRAPAEAEPMWDPFDAAAKRQHAAELRRKQADADRAAVAQRIVAAQPEHVQEWDGWAGVGYLRKRQDEGVRVAH